MIEHPALSYLTNPTEFEPPDAEDEVVKEQIRQLMYMYLSMFDVAFNYYDRKVGHSWLLTKFGWNEEEIDHWEGWKDYISWFVHLSYVEDQYSKEAHKWYGKRFKRFLRSLNTKLPNP